MRRNVSRTTTARTPPSAELSHDAVKGIVAAAAKGGSSRTRVEDYALPTALTTSDKVFSRMPPTSPALPSDGRRVGLPALNSASPHPVQPHPYPVGRHHLLRRGASQAVTQRSLLAKLFFSVTQRTTTRTTIYIRSRSSPTSGRRPD